MKRRRLVLELHTNSTYTKVSESSSAPKLSVSTAKEVQPLVSYGEDDDRDQNLSNPSSVDSNDQKPCTTWQMCVDENTKYTYYWNVLTNQVTWEPPAEYLAYEAALHRYNNSSQSEDENVVDGSVSTNNLHNKITPTAPLVVRKSGANDGDKSKSDLFPAFGPLSEQEINAEESEAKKMASARKRLQSYKIAAVKSKVKGEPLFSNSCDKLTAPSASQSLSIQTSSNVKPSSPTVSSFKSDVKIPFIPTAEEVKVHPIFSKSSSLSRFDFVGSTRSINRSDGEKKFTNSSNENQSNQMQRLRIIDENYSDTDDDEEDDEDDVIISRLRKKALLLKELGGDVPKEILSVLDQSKTAEDIIAEIEKEIPSELNEHGDSLNITSTQVQNAKPLFPSIDYNTSKPNSRVNVAVHKTKMKNVQKIKLSARARELIKTSFLTAKARATNFVETEDGLKPAEEVERMKKRLTDTENEVTIDPSQVTKNSDDEKRRLENLSAIETELNALEALQAAEETVTACKTTKDAKQEVENDKSKEDMFSFQKSFIILNPKRPKVLDDIEAQEHIAMIPSANQPTTNNVSLVSKCEEFLESVKKSASEVGTTKKVALAKDEDKKPITKQCTSKMTNDIDLDDVFNTTNKNKEKTIVDMSQLVMEKLKFLSVGKGLVAPVQVMAIQIETLVGAWQTGALNVQYLSDWLDASAVHLKNIEDSAAPDGWQCEWDRSYGRYYYRNKITGAIQWDFPEEEDPNILVSKKASHKKCAVVSPVSESSYRSQTPPPPPSIWTEMVPPPPPIISDYESRKRKVTSGIESDAIAEVKRKADDKRNLYLPSLPETPEKVPTPPPTPPPPPPPPSSPPPQPPPPPTPPNEPYDNMAICDQDVKPANEHNIHEALDSFYSDIASLEATSLQSNNDTISEKPTLQSTERNHITPEIISVHSPKHEEKTAKKKKKVKLDSSLSLKKKGLEGLVAKWQKVSSDGRI